MPLPPYMSVDRESRAARWTGVPSAVYKLDLDGLGDLDLSDKEQAVARILDWLSAYENNHDGWVLTPSTFMFATDGTGGDDDADDDGAKGTCIGNRMMPIRYSMVDADTSRRTLLTCADGAPFVERSLAKADWVAYSNDVFYHKGDKRRSDNDLCQILMAHGWSPIGGPVVLTCF